MSLAIDCYCICHNTSDWKIHCQHCQGVNDHTIRYAAQLLAGQGPVHWTPPGATQQIICALGIVTS